MKFYRRIFLTGLSLALAGFVFAHLSLAVTQDDLNAVESKINDLRNKIGQIQTQKNTLNNKITFYNNQIELTSLQIEQTTLQIASLSARINNLENRLDHLSDIFVKRTVESYQISSKLDPLGMFLSSNNFSAYMDRVKYLRVIQASDKKLMIQLEETRTNYDGQKINAELLATRLETQKSTLDQQKKESTYLLEKYKTDEKKYQSQLDSALAEQSAMESVLSQALTLLQNGVKVNAGDAIAQIGNTGYPTCSTGEHLHFEVRKDKVAVNPADYLKNIDVVWDNKPDGPFPFTGSWNWPIENPRIHQGFGKTYWARLGWYSSGIHTGLDMTSETSSIIRTPVSGTLYKGITSCGPSPLKFVAVEADNNTILWFWHVQ